MDFQLLMIARRSRRRTEARRRTSRYSPDRPDQGRDLRVPAAARKGAPRKRRLDASPRRRRPRARLARDAGDRRRRPHPHDLVRAPPRTAGRDCRDSARRARRSRPYYFRTTPRFETGHPKYAFLNRLVAVASGDSRPQGPIYTVDEILRGSDAIAPTDDTAFEHRACARHRRHSSWYRARGAKAWAPIREA